MCLLRKTFSENNTKHVCNCSCIAILWTIYALYKCNHRTYPKDVACRQKGDAYSSGHLVLSHLGLACVLMLKPISPELVMFSDFEFQISHGTSISLCSCNYEKPIWTLPFWQKINFVSQKSILCHKNKCCATKVNFVTQKSHLIYKSQFCYTNFNSVSQNWLLHKSLF